MTWNRIKKILNWLVGDAKEFAVEGRLFNTISLLNGITNLIGLAGVVQLKNYQLLFVIQFLVGLFFFGFYFFSRFQKMGRQLRWPFIIVTGAFIFISAMYNGGAQGGTSYYIFPAFYKSGFSSFKAVWGIMSFYTVLQRY